MGYGVCRYAFLLLLVLSSILSLTLYHSLVFKGVGRYALLVLSWPTHGYLPGYPAATATPKRPCADLYRWARAMGPGRRSGPSAPQDLIGVKTAAAFPTTRHWRLDCPPSLSPLLHHRLEDVIALSPNPCPKRLAAPTGSCRGVTALAGLVSGSRASYSTLASKEVPGMPPVFGAGSTIMRCCLPRTARDELTGRVSGSSDVDVF